jgi:uncharacterized membrane protein YdjX (TVP38/TMEM64 family)
MKKYIPLALIIIVFLFSSFLSQQHSDIIGEVILQNKIAGIIIYMIAVILAIVIAPLTSIPFIPLVVGVWGVFLTSVLSIIGWTLGSMAAFWIARKFGAPIVKKIVSVDDKKKRFYENISEHRMFWYLLLLRITIPVDILSYMLGLFTNISWRLFTTTTFIGVIPIVILLSVFGVLSIKYQIIVALMGIILVILFVFIKKSKSNKLKKNYEK